MNLSKISNIPRGKKYMASNSPYYKYSAESYFSHFPELSLNFAAIHCNNTSYNSIQPLAGGNNTSFLCQNTSSTFPLPSGKTTLPSGKMNNPSGKMSLLSGKMDLPSGKMDLPSGKMDLPSLFLNVPEAFSNNYSAFGRFNPMLNGNCKQFFLVFSQIIKINNKQLNTQKHE